MTSVSQRWGTGISWNVKYGTSDNGQ